MKKKLILTLSILAALVVIIGGIIIYRNYSYCAKRPPLFLYDESVLPTPVDPEILKRYPNLPPTVPPDPNKAIKHNPDFSKWMTRCYPTKMSVAQKPETGKTETTEKIVKFSGETTNNLPGAPVILYSEKIDGGTYRLWAKRGIETPEILMDTAKSFSYIQNIPIGNDTYALFSFDKELIAINPLTKEKKILFTADAYISHSNSYVSNSNTTPSINKKRFIIIAEEYPRYFLYKYDVENNTATLLRKGEYLPFSSISQWIENKNILIVGADLGGSYIFDLATGKTKEISADERRNLVDGGKTFYAIPIENFENNCMMGNMLSPSIYEIRDSKTGKAIGKFGEKGKQVLYFRYSSEGNEVLFSVSPIRSDCRTIETFYRINFEQPEQIQKVEDYKTVLAQWYPDEYYSEQKTEKETKIFSQRGDILFTLSGYEFVSLSYDRQSEQQKFNIFGGAKFDTSATGYLKIQEEEIFNEKIKRAYFTITDYKDEQFMRSLKAGIERGNGVNKKEKDLYLFSLGCFKDGKIVGSEYTEPYIDKETREALLRSSANNPTAIRLYFDYHDGRGCICCNLAHKVRTAK